MWIFFSVFFSIFPMIFLEIDAEHANTPEV